MFGYEKDIHTIKVWMKRNKVSPSTLGVAALNRSAGLQRLLEGKSTLRSLQRTLRHIRRYPKVKQASRGK